MNQAFTIEEGDDGPVDPVEFINLMYPHVDFFTGLRLRSEELNKRAEHEEFWSDPCWAKPL